MSFADLIHGWCDVQNVTLERGADGVLRLVAIGASDGQKENAAANAEAGHATSPRGPNRNDTARPSPAKPKSCRTQPRVRQRKAASSYFATEAVIGHYARPAERSAPPSPKADPRLSPTFAMLCKEAQDELVKEWESRR